MRTTIAQGGKATSPQTIKKTKDLWLAFSPISNTAAFANAICALYYLPEQYKLIVTGAEISMEIPAAHLDLKNRIQITEEKTELSDKTTPFAFIYGDMNKTTPLKTAKNATPTVIMTDQPEQYVKDNEWDGFTVPTNTPEALASAILNIAHTSIYNGLRLAKQSFAHR